MQPKQTTRPLTQEDLIRIAADAGILPYDDVGIDHSDIPAIGPLAYGLLNDALYEGEFSELIIPRLLTAQEHLQRLINAVIYHCYPKGVLVVPEGVFSAEDRLKVQQILIDRSAND